MRILGGYFEFSLADRGWATGTRVCRTGRTGIEIWCGGSKKGTIAARLIDVMRLRPQPRVQPNPSPIPIPRNRETIARGAAWPVLPLLANRTQEASLLPGAPRPPTLLRARPRHSAVITVSQSTRTAAHGLDETRRQNIKQSSHLHIQPLGEPSQGSLRPQGGTCSSHCSRVNNTRLNGGSC